MKKIVSLLLVLLFLLPSADAQQRDDLRRQYEEFKRNRRREFQDFKAKANAEFAEFLKQSWCEYNPRKAEPAPIPVVQPKPEVVPESTTPDLPRPDADANLRRAREVEQMSQPSQPATQPETQPTQPATQPATQPETLPTQPTQPTDPSQGKTPPTHVDRPTAGGVGGAVAGGRSDRDAESTAARRSGAILSLNFCGDALEIPWNKALAPQLRGADEQGFSTAWSAMSQAQDDATIDYIERYAKAHGLNGWGYYQLVRRISEQACTADRPDDRVALQAFLLSQLRFKAQVAAAGGRLVLLLPFREPVYGVRYIDMGGVRYYIYGEGDLPAASGFRTYQNTFSYAENRLSLALDGTMDVGLDAEIASPRWSKLLDREVKFPLDVGTLALLLDYPLVDPEVYYSQGIPERLSESVLGLLRPLVAGKSKRETVAFLLDLVQHGFDYAIDEEVFGRQKPLFVEESLYYGRNNCKDRVGVLSWLVRSLTGLDVIFVRWDGNAGSDGVGHIACAIRFDETVEGDAYTYKGKRYVVCDPTYINAGIGQAMPAYVSQQAEIIAL